MKGGWNIHGRFTRDYKNSPRPPRLWPETWQRMTDPQRFEEEVKWEQVRKQIHEIDPTFLSEKGGGSSSSIGLPAVASANETAPPMPTMPCTHEHRPHEAEHELPFSALVARPVSKAEIRSSSEAQAALKKEWDRLRAAGCWDESKVREWSTVAKEAREANKKVHVGMIFEICVEKGS